MCLNHFFRSLKKKNENQVKDFYQEKERNKK